MGVGYPLGRQVVAAAVPTLLRTGPTSGRSCSAWAPSARGSRRTPTRPPSTTVTSRIWPPCAGVDPDAALAASPEPGPERLNDLAIRTGPWGDRYGENPDGLTLEKLKEHPDGVDFGPMVPRIDEIVLHDDGKIDLAPSHIIGDIGRLADRLDRPVEPLVLTSRRHLRSNNSWMHNVKVLVSGKERCTLLIHPDDAAARGVDDGAVAVVSSSNGSIEVLAEVSDEMMPGVVSLPHGWGHDKPGTRQSVAREHAGVNNNLLAPPDFLDVPSGNAAVNGIPVEVAPA